MRVRVAGCLILAATAACTGRTRPETAATPTVQYLTPYGPLTRPFSPAVRVGNMLYLSGQIGTPPDVERARALAQRLPVTIAIEGPVVRWRSEGAILHRGSWQESEDSLLSRTTADDHRIASVGLGKQDAHRLAD